MNPGPIRVLLADDHDVVREGLKASLQDHPDLQLIGEARDGLEAVRLARHLGPDLIVMDVRMPRLSGIEACREIRSEQPACNVLMLTSFGDEDAVMASIMAGAGGFMLKDVRVGALIEAMRTVGRGGTTLDPVSAATIVNKFREGLIVSRDDQLAQQLSPRENDILDLVAAGLTNREIGERLFLSEKTVKHYVSEILAKLGLSRRVEAAAFAVRRAVRRPEGPRG